MITGSVQKAGGRVWSAGLNLGANSENHTMGEKRQKMEKGTEEDWLGGRGDLKGFWRATSIRKDFLVGNRVQ